MQPEIPTQSVAAIATVIAALLAGAISFVNLTLDKEQKISEFRQAWIDGLREDLATFFACARAFARATQELKAFGPGDANGSIFPISAERISDIRFQVAETMYRIQLRLNLNEVEHKEMLRLMRAAIQAQQNEIQGQGETAGTLKAIENAADFAPQILKTEWDRVRKGELAFRVARNWIAPAVFGVAVLFVIFLASGKLKI